MFINIEGLSKKYRDANSGDTSALDGINLSVSKGEFVSIFGPNGCGKTTLLNVIAGLVPFDSGTIRIGDKPQGQSRIGFVFQDYGASLFPWLRNIDNIVFSLDRNPGSLRQKRSFAREFVKKMGLADLPLDRYPYECSAGQQQLVALIRELIYEPDVLLMDEPFVSLDYDRRLAQQRRLLDTWERTGVTVLFVSHEIDEAIYLADRLILLSRRPARVVNSYNIGLPRPRIISMTVGGEFLDIKAPILEAFGRTCNEI